MARLIFLPLIILMFGCVENNPQPVNNHFLIAGDNDFGKTWSISEIEVELGTLVPRPCVTDNFITYFPNGKYEINEGATKCDPNDPPAVTGTWEMNSDQTRLFVTIGDSLQVWDLESIDRLTHRITSSFQEGDRTYSLSFVN